MRRILILLAAFAVTAASIPHQAFAQMRPRGDSPSSDDEDTAADKKRDKEWGDSRAPLRSMRNAGPCPFVKVLYDASRYVEFKDGREASSNVGYSGEIQGVSAGCEYKDGEPIKVKMEVLFELGKGPMAQAGSKTYRYWVAVTSRNQAVISKQTFDLPVKFAEGQDRVYVTQDIGQITIPRATATTSGANFEILVGFEVTPQMAAFNREGKRFRLNAGAAAAASGTDAARQ